MLINCPECKSSISDKAENCPHCAFPINKKKEEGSKEGCFLQTLNFGCMVIAIIIGIAILAIIFS